MTPAGLATALAARLPGQVGVDISSADFTTYRCGGTFACFVRARSVDDLAVVAELLPPEVPVLVVGRGSNLVVADRGFDGVAVHLEDAFDEVELDAANGCVRAGGAVALPVLARRASAAGLSGLEFYVGIPGSVGGAVRMNAGGHGRDTSEVLRSAHVVDLRGGDASDRTVSDLGLGYRRSALTATDVVCKGEFTVVPDLTSACEARLAEVVRWRRENQPGGSNAGSVFTNPPGDAAGRIIDACGLKGLRVGGAVVSAKHANFFIAEEGATAGDIRALVEEVARRVEAATGVKLHPELLMVGFEEEAPRPEQCGRASG